MSYVTSNRAIHQLYLRYLQSRLEQIPQLFMLDSSGPIRDDGVYLELSESAFVSWDSPFEKAPEVSFTLWFLPNLKFDRRATSHYYEIPTELLSEVRADLLTSQYGENRQVARRQVLSWLRSVLLTEAELETKEARVWSIEDSALKDRLPKVETVDPFNHVCLKVKEVEHGDA